jgi:hypothetical protein
MTGSYMCTTERSDACPPLPLGSGKEVPLCIVDKAQTIGDGGHLILEQGVGEPCRHSIRGCGKLGHREGIALGIGAVSRHPALLYSVRLERKERSTR